MSLNLLDMVESGGCSSKISPKQLEEILKYLPLPDDKNILVDITTHDDAGVYRVNDELALVFTTDFFPPVCNDPYEFGQIAAANALSDVYAMGGTPVIALNIMMFPSAKLPMEAYSGILRGGYDKAVEAGVSIIGGHTIDDFPPKYGLSLVGYVNPGEIITNSGATPGDNLILTKPVGTGVMLAGNRLEMITNDNLASIILSMKQINRGGAEVMKKHGIRGATDITGFGLAGHALKMARASNVSLSFNLGKLPLFSKTYDLLDAGCIPGAAFRNLDFAESDSIFAGDLDYNLKMASCDAQTSGGLLMSVSAKLTDSVLGDLYKSGFTHSSVIGKVTDKRDKFLYFGN